MSNKHLVDQAQSPGHLLQAKGVAVNMDSCGVLVASAYSLKAERTAYPRSDDLGYCFF